MVSVEVVRRTEEQVRNSLLVGRVYEEKKANWLVLMMVMFFGRLQRREDKSPSAEFLLEKE